MRNCASGSGVPPSFDKCVELSDSDGDHLDDVQRSFDEVLIGGWTTHESTMADASKWGGSDLLPPSFESKKSVTGSKPVLLEVTSPQLEGSQNSAGQLEPMANFDTYVGCELPFRSAAPRRVVGQSKGIEHTDENEIDKKDVVNSIELTPSQLDGARPDTASYRRKVVGGADQDPTSNSMTNEEFYVQTSFDERVWLTDDRNDEHFDDDQKEILRVAVAHMVRSISTEVMQAFGHKRVPALAILLPLEPSRLRERVRLVQDLYQDEGTYFS